MMTYISLLRGINVSGQKKVPMAELKKLYESLGFQDVQTYIQSGNVVFKAEEDRNLASLIEKRIHEHFGFEVPVLILTRGDLVQILSENPFVISHSIDSLHVTMLSQMPDNELLSRVVAINSGEDEYVVVGKNIYLNCPEGYGRTKLTNNFFESKLKCKATTRNWKTMLALDALTKE